MTKQCGVGVSIAFPLIVTGVQRWWLRPHERPFLPYKQTNKQINKQTNNTISLIGLCRFIISHLVCHKDA